MQNGFGVFVLPVLFGGKTDDPERSRERRQARHQVDNRSASRFPAANAEDLILVTCIREGDEIEARAAFDQLYERLFERLFKFTMRLLGDADAVYDVVQDAFVSLWVSRKTWHAPGGSDAYLYTAVRNQALKRFRHQGVVDRAEPSRIPTPAGLAAPDSSVEEGEFDRAFKTALLTLSERRQSAFLLHAIDGLSYEAIGQVLGISKPAAFKQVMAAIASLRDQLSRFA